MAASSWPGALIGRNWALRFWKNCQISLREAEEGLIGAEV